MTFVGLAGLILGLSAVLVAFRHWTHFRAVIFLLAYVLHVATSVVGYNMALTGPADAYLYYHDPFGEFTGSFGFNTVFIIAIVQTMKSIVGGSFLDYFLIFQAFGFFGIALLMRVFEEIHEELQIPDSRLSYLLFLLPSLHFWSSSIGKDAPFFFSIALCIWSAMNIRRRFVQFGAASFLLLAIRPHIAILALSALALAVVTDRRTKLHVRIGLAGIAMLGVSYAVATVLGTFNIDLTNSDVLSDRLAAREELIQTEDAGRSMVSASFPVRLASLLFRPLFFDADGGAALAASAENALILIMMLAIVWNFRSIIRILKSVFFLRYASVFTAALMILLAFEYYNVGLGLRQKWAMIMPGLLVLGATLRAVTIAGRQKLDPNQLAAELQWASPAASLGSMPQPRPGEVAHHSA